MFPAVARKQGQLGGRVCCNVIQHRLQACSYWPSLLCRPAMYCVVYVYVMSVLVEFLNVVAPSSRMYCRMFHVIT